MPYATSSMESSSPPPSHWTRVWIAASTGRSLSPLTKICESASSRLCSRSMAQQQPLPPSRPMHINIDGSDVGMLSKDHFIEEEDAVANPLYLPDPTHAQVSSQYIKLYEIMGQRTETAGDNSFSVPARSHVLDRGNEYPASTDMGRTCVAGAEGRNCAPGALTASPSTAPATSHPVRTITPAGRGIHYYFTFIKSRTVAPEQALGPYMPSSFGKKRARCWSGADLRQFGETRRMMTPDPGRSNSIQGDLDHGSAQAIKGRLVLGPILTCYARDPHCAAEARRGAHLNCVGAA
ncbi:hypothetical protein V500_06521 [Pseudogymnoascus sp. VKM F-4518 (FW-2643)]|nr:hypothetical protein V500_06521 [Pseudogymnoascus sp. VKM F-4518 (FW-2643)]